MRPASDRKVAYKRGPAKGTRPLIDGLGITRADHMLAIADQLIAQGTKPTLKAIEAASEHLTLGFLYANSTLLADARERWRREGGGRRQGLTDDRRSGVCEVLASDKLERAEAQVERARKELEAERVAHAHTKRELRRMSHVLQLMMKKAAQEFSQSELSARSVEATRSTANP